jgi:hypothetical protein
MRKSLLAALVLGAAIAIGMAPDAAQARDYPFCIKGGGYESSVGDCSFDTYQQCLATASGRFDYCDVNPFYAYPEGHIARPRKRHSHY